MEITWSLLSSNYEIGVSIWKHIYRSATARGERLTNWSSKSDTHAIIVYSDSVVVAAYDFESVRPGIR